MIRFAYIIKKLPSPKAYNKVATLVKSLHLHMLIGKDRYVVIYSGKILILYSSFRVLPLKYYISSQQYLIALHTKWNDYQSGVP